MLQNDAKLDSKPSEIVNALFEYINLMNGPDAFRLGVKDSFNNELLMSVLESENGIEFEGFGRTDVFINRQRLERFLGDKLKKKL